LTFLISHQKGDVVPGISSDVGWQWKDGCSVLTLIEQTARAQEWAGYVLIEICWGLERLAVFLGDFHGGSAVF